MKKTVLWLALGGLCLWPSPLCAADFGAAARAVKDDLAKARQEYAETGRRLAQKEAELGKELAALKSRLAAEKGRLLAAQKELERLGQARVQLKEKLAGKEAGLKELAGAVRGCARDMLALAERSPVTAQQPDRLKILRGYLDENRFPGLDDLKKLVEIHLAEIKDSGGIARWQGPFVDVKGREVGGDLVRLGALAAVFKAEGQAGFLTLGPASGQLLAAGGDLPWGVERNLRSYLRGESPSVYLDIAGGAALRQLARQQGLWEHLLSGGPLVWPILLVGLAALVIIIERLLFLRRVRANTDVLMDRINRQVVAGDYESAQKEVEAHPGWPTSNVIKAGLALRGCSAEVIESGLAEAMFKELPRLERFLTALKVLVAVAPLLGLLGTVTGMINTFQVITAHGSGDPRLLAGGISEALVTTELGLAVAIPVMVVAALITRRAQTITSDMEEKAVALSAALSRAGG